MEERNQEKKCEFGVCKNYLICSRDKKEPCELFAECKTYMDKYDNNMGIWSDVHDWGNDDDYDDYGDYDGECDYEGYEDC